MGEVKIKREILFKFTASVKNSANMTVMALFSCALTAYSPALALFTVTIAKDPVRVIILILSAFFWLLPLLFSSILWSAVVPLKQKLAFGLVFSIFFQELFRYEIYANKHILSYVVGLGFGMMSGVFSLVNVLADSVGPGTVGFNDEPQDFFMISSLLCMAMILLHTFWGVIAFDAWDQRKWLNLIYVWASHLTVSCLTLLNEKQHYWASAIPMYACLFASGLIAFRVTGGQFQKALACLKCYKPENLQVDAPEDQVN